MLQRFIACTKLHRLQSFILYKASSFTNHIPQIIHTYNLCQPTHWLYVCFSTAANTSSQHCECMFCKGDCPIQNPCLIITGPFPCLWCIQFYKYLLYLTNATSTFTSKALLGSKSSFTRSRNLIYLQRFIMFTKLYCIYKALSCCKASSCYKDLLHLQSFIVYKVSSFTNHIPQIVHKYVYNLYLYTSYRAYVCFSTAANTYSQHCDCMFCKGDCHKTLSHHYRPIFMFVMYTNISDIWAKLHLHQILDLRPCWSPSNALRRVGIWFVSNASSWYFDCRYI